MQPIHALTMGALLLAGCATPVATHPDLPGRTAVEMVCSPMAATEAKRRLQQAWEGCYAKAVERAAPVRAGGVVAMVPLPVTEARVVAEGPPDAGSLQLLMGRSRVLQAEFQRTGSCAALVVLDSNPGLWVSAARNTQAWLADPAAPGPAGNCR